MWRETNGGRGGGFVAQFQSTPSVWRETRFAGDLMWNKQISIHSLRVEGDDYAANFSVSLFSFQSTPSVWRETNVYNDRLTEYLFQSTPSVWRETASDQKYNWSLNISIHSLRVEGDRLRLIWSRKPCYFNPLPPCGGRRALYPWQVQGIYFNPLPPCGGRPGAHLLHRWCVCVISIHSLRVEGD